MSNLSLPRLLTALLLLGSGILMLLLGNGIPLLVATVGLLVGGILRPDQGASSAWISTLGGVALFLSGTPLTGSPPEGLLISAVMALYFICWIQLGKGSPLSAFSPTGPFTLMFYGTLLLAYFLLQSQLFPLPQVICVLLACVFILVALALWEIGRRSRLAQAAQAQSPTFPDWVGRFVVLFTILLTTFLLFRLPLPWIADGALNVAAELNLTATPPSSKNRDRQPSDDDWNSKDKEKSIGQGDPAGPAGESDGDSPWRRGSLPKQADLEMSEVARFHLQIPDEEQAKRVVGRPLYLRAHTLAQFEGNRWSRAPYEGHWIKDGDDGKEDGWVTMSQAPADRVIHQRLYVYNHLRSGSLLSIPNALAFKGKEIFRQSDDFLSNRDAGDITYEIVSAPVFYDDVVGAKVLEAGEAPPHCLEKAKGLTFRDIDNLILSEIRRIEPTVKQKLTFLRRLFEEQFEYSLVVENTGNHDPLANFLFHERRGYCDFYAQAGAHMLRALDLPSRVAYGYAGGIYNPSQSLYTFREADAHAWTEVFLKDHGWVIFDLVRGGQGPSRPAETQAVANRIGDPLARFREAEEERRREQEPVERSSPLLPDWEDWLEDLWLFKYLDIILGLSILGLLATYTVRRWRQRKDRKPRNSSSPAFVRRDPPGYFRDFCELFADQGHTRHPGQTLREYLKSLKNAQLINSEFDPLEIYHYGVEYENRDRSRSQEKQFRREIRNFRVVR